MSKNQTKKVEEKISARWEKNSVVFCCDSLLALIYGVVFGFSSMVLTNLFVKGTISGILALVILLIMVRRAKKKDDWITVLVVPPSFLIGTMIYVGMI